MNKKLTQEDFLSRLISIHGDKYIFDKTTYINNRTKVIVTCPIHGDFEKFPSNLLSGSGCKKCASDKLRKSQADFLSELKSIHGDKYGYDKVVYVSDATKVIITCPTHGDFEIRPNDILKGVGCNKCRNKPLNEWINNFRAIHGDKYGYGNVPYVLARTPISVTCFEHGDFNILPSNHLNGVGCPECFIVHNKLSKNDFVEKVSFIHNNYYDYSDTVYSGYSEFIDINCPVHGVFRQKAFSHASGHGCPKCFGKISKPEFEIVEYIESLGIPEDKILMSSSPDFMIGKQQLDIYLPDYGFAIEFNGSRWHSENLGKPNSYHFDKWKMCNDAGVKLLTIWDFNWVNPIKRKIYESKISHFLYKDIIVPARKTKIVIINKDIAISFVRQNHLEGFGVPYKNSRYIGLFKDEQLFMVAIYGEFYSQGSKEFVWKLQRICTLCGVTVSGGVSKLSSYIKNDVGSFVFQITLDTGGTITSYYSIKDQVSLRYWWVNSKLEVKSRNSTQVSVLKQSSSWIEGDTENSYMERLGYYKVYDCGIATLLN